MPQEREKEKKFQNHSIIDIRRVWRIDILVVASRTLVVLLNKYSSPGKNENRRTRSFVGRLSFLT